jgi:fructokinase
VIQVGVDFGGTKIEAAALDGEGRFLARRRAPNPGGYEAAIREVCRLVDEVEAEAGRRGTIGVGGPGSISPRTGVVRNANTVWLNGKPFRDDLEAALKRPVRLANDANCLALSESLDGAAAGASVTFAVIIGTGCGGGLVAGGRLVEGANGFAGEWGHTSLPWPRAGEAPGPLCWCGLRGCLETWISGPAFQRDHREGGGDDLTPPQIVEAAQVGEPRAVAALERYVDRLGRGLAMIVNIVDPEVFVFGGGMSNVADLYPRLTAATAPYVFGDSWTAKLAPARWGDSSGVRGAARLWAAPDAG